MTDATCRQGRCNGSTRPLDERCSRQRAPRQTFKQPAKGKVREIKIDSFTRANEPAPGVGCDVSYDQTEAKGTVQVRLKTR
jgi:hypothetical protein